MVQTDCGAMVLDLPGILRRIETRLKKVGLSANAASDRAGKPDAIRNLRRAVKEGSRKGISTVTIQALAPVLETSPEWLLAAAGERDVPKVVSEVSPAPPPEYEPGNYYTGSRYYGSRAILESEGKIAPDRSGNPEPPETLLARFGFFVLKAVSNPKLRNATDNDLRRLVSEALLSFGAHEVSLDRLGEVVQQIEAQSEERTLTTTIVHSKERN